MGWVTGLLALGTGLYSLGQRIADNAAERRPNGLIARWRRSGAEKKKGK